jgi:hypothetical protein
VGDEATAAARPKILANLPFPSTDTLGEGTSTARLKSGTERSGNKTEPSARRDLHPTGVRGAFAPLRPLAVSPTHASTHSFSPLATH